MLSPGLYEQIINTALNHELSEIPVFEKRPFYAARRPAAASAVSSIFSAKMP